MATSMPCLHTSRLMFAAAPKPGRRGRPRKGADDSGKGTPGSGSLNQVNQAYLDELRREAAAREAARGHDPEEDPRRISFHRCEGTWGGAVGGLHCTGHVSRHLVRRRLRWCHGCHSANALAQPYAPPDMPHCLVTVQGAAYSS